MAHILIMPRQGNTVESCIITGWKVKEGDKVTSESTVCEVETDKAAFEIPAGEAGIVLKLLFNSGDDVPVLSPIAVIGGEGEDWSAALSVEMADTQRKEENRDRGAAAQIQGIAATDRRPEISENRESSDSNSSLQANHPPISPRARILAEKEAFPFETLKGTGPDGRIIELDVLTALEQRPALTAAAKAAAGIVPQYGTGLAGRVTADDMLQQKEIKTPVIQGAPLPHDKSESVFTFSPEGAVTETPLKGIRRVISDKMLKSLSDTAQFTLSAYASAVKLQDIRSRIKILESVSGGINPVKITINDLILFAVSRVLPRFSFMNAHKIENTVKVFERVHLGVAVDTPRGLMVPVIRNANLLSLPQISAESKRLSASCQNGSVKQEELSGSTFSVTNLGSFGITSFTPVLNVPEVAILGVCGIELKPVSVEGGVNECCNYSFEPHIGFSLTINHQAVDGAPAARFLKALCEAAANIDILSAVL